MLRPLAYCIGLACLGLAACSELPSTTAGTDPSPQYDGLYKGTAMMTHEMSPLCGNSGFFHTKLDVSKGDVRWHTGTVQPYDYQLVQIPVAPNGTFEGNFGGRYLMGRSPGTKCRQCRIRGAAASA